MTSDQKIAVVVGKARLTWVSLTILAVVGVLLFLPMWYLLLVLPFSVAVYTIAMVVAIAYLGRTISTNEIEAEKTAAALKKIQEKLDRFEVDQGPELFSMLEEAGVADVEDVTKVSDEIVGTFDGKTMYEWIEVHDPHSGKIERFHYHMALRKGMMAPRPEEGKIFANVEGIIYARDIHQPV